MPSKFVRPMQPFKPRPVSKGHRRPVKLVRPVQCGKSREFNSGH